jgi:hypothetical protein
MARDTLFISHATPEDNEFAIWLASRLEMLGYKIWIDKEKLLGGETFWQEIQNAIKNDTIKFLLVYSENICDKNGNLKEGINKELSYAESIAKIEKIKDFIIPLHIDKKASFHEFIGANILTHIPFDENWAVGLSQLKEKLEQSLIPKEANQDGLSFTNWYENNYYNECKVIEKEEQLYSSWWKIAEIPDKFFLYFFPNNASAEKIKENNNHLPLGIINNIITTFDDSLNMNVNDELGEYSQKINTVKVYSINDIIHGFKSNVFPSYRDIKNHFINLLNSVITKIFNDRGMLPYDLSNGTAYFLPKKEKFSRIKFIFPNTEIKKRKTIGGEYLNIGYWHYGISVKPILFPIIGYSIKSHIIFTSDGYQIIYDHKKQHSYRRNKGKTLFNDVWRNLQLAYIQNLKNLNNNIETVVSKDNKMVRMKEWPEIFFSNFGYNEPKSNMDKDKIENYYEEQFEYEGINEDE